MKIKFQVWKNQGICKKKVGKIRGKSGNFITGEINQGTLLWFMIDESMTVLGYKCYILGICKKCTPLGYAI